MKTLFAALLLLVSVSAHAACDVDLTLLQAREELAQGGRLVESGFVSVLQDGGRMQAILIQDSQSQYQNILITVSGQCDVKAEVK